MCRARNYLIHFNLLFDIYFSQLQDYYFVLAHELKSYFSQIIEEHLTFDTFRIQTAVMFNKYQIKKLRFRFLKIKKIIQKLDTRLFHVIVLI